MTGKEQRVQVIFFKFEFIMAENQTYIIAFGVHDRVPLFCSFVECGNIYVLENTISFILK